MINDTLNIVGRAIELSTKGRPNFTVHFTTETSAALIVKYIKFELIQHWTTYEFVCVSDEVFDKIMAEGAK